ncbi:hypothetical protein [Virgibacillus ndiopensis]|uniref:hypothetical protein n=1 Tax=Virgibacillus ndiopensis TaxID=2004408 RepID=UPI000C06D01C|nr:hypothetical protein [Virgibacillus ndiopensis]
MQRKEWEQPKWFWWSISLFLLLEYGFMFMLALTGAEPLKIINSSYLITFIIFPLFFIIVLLFLPKKLRFDLDTMFYLLVPFILFLPNWTIISECLNSLF